MEQTTKHFILKDSGLHHIPDVPYKPFHLSFSNIDEFESAHAEYEKQLKKAIASSIPVDNQEEVKRVLIDPEYPDGVRLRFNEILSLECEIKIRVDCTKKECNGDCVEEKIAFVKLKEETKERERGINLIMVEDAVTKEEEQQDFLTRLRTQSSKRQRIYDDKEWSLPEWGCAVAGETGEMCNIIKKIHRGDYTLNEKREDLADEIADQIIYLDLLAKSAGIDLKQCITNKFNKGSAKIGCPEIKL